MDGTDGTTLTGARVRSRLVALRDEAAARVAELERQRAAAVEAAAGANADDEHDPEGATLAFEREQLAALLDRARATRAEAEAALVRLEEGAYGRCAVCGGRVGDERLDARPTATTCVRCAAEAGRR